MRDLLRTLILWFLVLSIPAQANAIASFAPCANVGHEHSVVLAHAAKSVHASSDHEPSVRTAKSAAKVDQATKAKTKCSVYVSGCSIGALTTTSVDITLDAANDEVGSTVTSFEFGFLTDGPERPPRPVL